MLRADRRITKWAVGAFVAVELVFFLLIQIGVDGFTNYIRFSSVVIAFLFSLALMNKSLDSLFVVLALLFTVCADYCLVIMHPEPKIVAMIFFSIVQLCYFMRLIFSEESAPLRITHIAVRASLIAVAVTLTVIVLGPLADALSIISIVYFANLATNIVFAFMERKKFLLFAIGLLCFALCDIFVGLGVLVSDYIEVEKTSLLYAMTHTDMDLIWFFYVPSQTLIAISNLKKGS